MKILWKWSLILVRKFGSCKVSPLEIHTLSFCLGFQNLIASHFWMIPLGRYLGFIAISLTDFSTIFRTVWSGQRNFPKQNSTASVSLYWHGFSLATLTPPILDFFFQQAQCGLDLRHITVVELVGVFPTLIGRIGAKVMPQPWPAAQVGGSSPLGNSLPINVLFLIRVPDFLSIESWLQAMFQYFCSGSIITMLIGMWLLIEIYSAEGNHQGSSSPPTRCFALSLCLFFPWLGRMERGENTKRTLSSLWSY